MSVSLVFRLSTPGPERGPSGTLSSMADKQDKNQHSMIPHCVLCSLHCAHPVVALPPLRSADNTQFEELTVCSVVEAGEEDQ